MMRNEKMTKLMETAFLFCSVCFCSDSYLFSNRTVVIKDAVAVLPTLSYKYFTRHLIGDALYKNGEKG